MRPLSMLLPCAALLAAGCAPMQRIPLGCVPKDVKVYVDGRLLDELPPELSLRSDQDHVVYLKGTGYRPELVVLHSQRKDGDSRLTPDELCVRPVLLRMEREVEVGIEPD